MGHTQRKRWRRRRLWDRRIGARDGIAGGQGTGACLGIGRTNLAPSHAKVSAQAMGSVPAMGQSQAPPLKFRVVFTFRPLLTKFEEPFGSGPTQQLRHQRVFFELGGCRRLKCRQCAICKGDVWNPNLIGTEMGTTACSFLSFGVLRSSAGMHPMSRTFPGPVEFAASVKQILGRAVFKELSHRGQMVIHRHHFGHDVSQLQTEVLPTKIQIGNEVFCGSGCNFMQGTRRTRHSSQMPQRTLGPWRPWRGPPLRAMPTGPHVVRIRATRSPFSQHFGPHVPIFGESYEKT